jgi:PGF-pre-PGF domain-containing protein
LEDIEDFHENYLKDLVELRGDYLNSLVDISKYIEELKESKTVNDWLKRLEEYSKKTGDPTAIAFLNKYNEQYIDAEVLPGIIDALNTSSTLPEELKPPDEILTYKEKLEHYHDVVYRLYELCNVMKQTEFRDEISRIVNHDLVYVPDYESLNHIDRSYVGLQWVHIDMLTATYNLEGDIYKLRRDVELRIADLTEKINKVEESWSHLKPDPNTGRIKLNLGENSEYDAVSKVTDIFVVSNYGSQIYEGLKDIRRCNTKQGLEKINTARDKMVTDLSSISIDPSAVRRAMSQVLNIDVDSSLDDEIYTALAGKTYTLEEYRYYKKEYDKALGYYNDFKERYESYRTQELFDILWKQHSSDWTTLYTDEDPRILTDRLSQITSGERYLREQQKSVEWWEDRVYHPEKYGSYKYSFFYDPERYHHYTEILLKEWNYQIKNNEDIKSLRDFVNLLLEGDTKKLKYYDELKEIPYSYLKLLEELSWQNNLDRSQAEQVILTVPQILDKVALEAYNDVIKKYRNEIVHAQELEKKVEDVLGSSMGSGNINKQTGAPIARERADDSFDVSTLLKKSTKNVCELYMISLYESDYVDDYLIMSYLRKHVFDDDVLNNALHPETLWGVKKVIEDQIDDFHTFKQRFSNASIDYEFTSENETVISKKITVGNKTYHIVLKMGPDDVIYPIASFKDNPDLLKLREIRFLDTVKNLWSAPKVAVLRLGEYTSIVNFLLENNIYVSLIDEKASYEDMSKFDIIIIPSGSLDGLTENYAFRDTLRSYVYNGGKLIVFTQIKGSDYKILPRGEEIEAFGYMEDQSCQYSSSIIETYMPFLASQIYEKPSFSVDGFFMKVPENSTIVLRRVKNNQPTMIVYDYGLGKVIATTLYSDIAYTMHQMMRYEANLILDLINWCLEEDMETHECGEKARVKINITNYGTSVVDKIEFIVTDRSGKKVFGETRDVTINPNETKTFELSVNLNPGTYSVSYILYSNDNVTYIGVNKKRFAVTYFKAYKGGYTTEKTIYASLQSDGEIYPAGATAHMKLIIWNYGNQDEELRVLIDILHKPWKWYTVNVSANNYTVFEFEIPNLSKGAKRIWAHIYKGNKRIALANKGFEVREATLRVNIIPESFRVNRTINATITAENIASVPYNYTLSFLAKADGRTIYSEDIPLNMHSNERKTINVSFDVYPILKKRATVELIVAGLGAFAHETVNYIASDGVLRGKILDYVTHKPINATVWLYSPSKSLEIHAENGSFNVSLPGDTYTAIINASGYYKTMKVVDVYAEGVKDVIFYLMPIGSSEAYEFGEVYGNIYGYDGSLVESGQVTLIGENVSATINVSDGFYSFLVTPGKYTLEYRCGAFNLSGIPVYVKSAERIRQDLYVNASTVIGRVFDVVSDEPISNATVTIDYAMVVKTDENGFFRFTTFQGLHRINVSAEGYESSSSYIYANPSKAVYGKEVTVYKLTIPESNVTIAGVNMSDIAVDDYLIIKLNGETLELSSYVNNSKRYYKPINLSLKDGDELEIIGWSLDIGKLPEIYIYANNTSLKITDEFESRVYGEFFKAIYKIIKANNLSIERVGSTYTATIYLRPLLNGTVSFDIMDTLTGEELKKGTVRIEGNGVNLTVNVTDVVTLPPGRYDFSVSVDNYYDISGHFVVFSEKHVVVNAFMEYDKDAIGVAVRDEKPLSNAVVALPNLVIASDPSGTSPISVDDMLRVYINDKLVYETSDGLLYLYAESGDRIRLVAIDKGGKRELSELWLVNLYNNASIKLNDSVSEDSGYEFNATSPETVFFDEEITLNRTLGYAEYTKSLTNASGVAEINVPRKFGSPADIYDVFVWHEKYPAKMVRVQQTRGQHQLTPQEVVFNETVDGRKAVIKGRVVDFITLQPISNARVELDGVVKYTDNEGRFSFEVLKWYPVKKLVISKDGYYNETVAISVYEDERTIYLKRSEKRMTIEVVDFNGTAIPNATVEVAGNTAVTDKNGEVTLTLPIGLHKIKVERDGYDSYEGCLQVTWIKDREIVVLKAINYTSNEKGNVIVKVLDALTNQPIKGAYVNLYPWSSRYTDESGTVEFSNVDVKSYRLIVSRGGFEKVDFNPWVTVYPGRTTNVTVYLLTTKGNVNFKVLDLLTNEPIKGAYVNLYPWGSRYTDENGTVEFSNVDVKSYRLIVSRGGFEKVDFNPWVTVYPGRTTNVTVYLLTTKGSVNVKVLDLLTNEPIKGAYVNLYPWGSRYTDESGTVEFSNVDAKSYRLIVSRGGFEKVDFNPWVTVYPGRTTNVTVYLLTTKGSVNVKVLDLLTNEPIKGAYVNLYPWGSRYTDESGTVEFSNVDTKSYRLIVSRGGYEKVDFNPWVTVYPGRTTNVTVYLLTTKGNVNVKVLDLLTNQPIKGAYVNLYPWGSRYTDENGTVEFSNVDVKSYRLIVSKGGFEKVDFNPWVTVYPGRTTFVPVYLEKSDKTGTLNLTIVPNNASVEIDGKPIENTTLTLPAGVHTINITAKGYEPINESVYVFPYVTINKTYVLLPKLEGNCTFRLEVYDKLTDKPIENAEVRIIGKEAIIGHTNASGIFTAEVPAGHYKIEVERENYTKFEETVILQVGEFTKTVNLEPLGKHVVKPAVIKIIDVDPKQITLMAGSNATLNVTIMNFGDVAGIATINVSLEDAFFTTYSIPVNASETKTTQLDIYIPDDYLPCEKVIEISLDDQIVEIPVSIKGIKIAVSAKLDKKFYKEGENVTLTLTVKNLNDLNLTLFAKAKLGFEEDVEYFSLNGYETKDITLSVPFSEEDNKIMFGVYYGEGKALYLNAYYVRPYTDVVRVTTDKQQYRIGDKAKIIVEADVPGTIYFYPPKGWSIPSADVGTKVLLLSFGGSKEIEFTIPEEKAGTHLIGYSFVTSDGVTINGTLPVDVLGYDIKVLKIELTSVTPSKMCGYMLINASCDMNYTVLTLDVYDEDYDHVAGKIINTSLNAGLNNITFEIDLPNATGSLFLAYMFRVDIPNHSLVTITYGGNYLRVEDTVPPSVIETYPHDGAVGVPITSVISIKFSEEVLKHYAEGNFTITPAVNGTFYWEGRTMIFVPEELQPSTTYTVSVKFVDLAGNVGEHSFNFTTEFRNETNPPVVILTPSGGNVSRDVLFNVSASDDSGLKLLDVYVNGEECVKLNLNGEQTYSYVGKLPLVEGWNVIKVFAVDIYNNTGSNTSVVFVNVTPTTTPTPTTQTERTTVVSGGGSLTVLEYTPTLLYKIVKTLPSGIHEIKPSESITSTTGVTAIVVKLKRDSTIQAIISKPTDAKVELDYDVYRLFELEVSEYGKEISKSIEEAYIHFRVEKRWLEEKGYSPDDIALMKFDGERWIRLQTEKVDESEGYVYYKAKVDSFSLFAIVSKKKMTSGVQTTPTKPKVEVTTTPSVTESPMPKQTPSPVPAFEIVLIVTMAFAIAILITAWRKVKK